nr:MAG TPA: hypothetical protein [Caudoviricetes sp.]
MVIPPPGQPIYLTGVLHNRRYIPVLISIYSAFFMSPYMSALSHH